MPVITVARQFGAGGSVVAGLVAERLGCHLVDKSLIAEVARRLALPPAAVQAEDEVPRSLLDRLVRSFAPLAYDAGLAWEPPFPDPEYDPRRVILEITRQVIREAASGDVVILGRGAAEVLRDRQDALHVFLCAPVERRIEAVMSREGLGPTEARHRVERTDANRTAYMRQVYDVAWQDPLRYAMVMNTAVLGYEPAAELILAACR